MTFFSQILDVQQRLQALGHTVIVPDGAAELQGHLPSEIRALTGSAGKAAGNLIRQHFNHIKDSDAVLILNYEKNGVAHYIGANTFLEIGFAHVLDKPIYMLNDEPAQCAYRDELRAIAPIVLHGDLTHLPRGVPLATVIAA